MEYLKKRRLSLAFYEICKGIKTIDAALDYGFETSKGFSKAFKKEYGISIRNF